MGKTYRHQPGGYFDDERHPSKRSKQPNHANGRKSQGMKVVNSYDEVDEEEFLLGLHTFDDNDELNTHRDKFRR